jgi:hypothetical protein
VRRITLGAWIAANCAQNECAASRGRHAKLF